MNFNDFVSDAWNRHATHTDDIAKNLSHGITLIETNEQIPAMAHLITHVVGEHLGQWHDGAEVLLKLRSLAPYQSGTESDHSIERSIATLKIAAGEATAANHLSLSDQVRSISVAASALSSQNQTDGAIALFKQALAKASTIDKADPANRALAISSNNLAYGLEEKSDRTSSEKDLMILAAQTGRKYWEIAGSWLEVERAEYRLAMSFAKAGDGDKSLHHALQCLAIARANSAPPMELFFGNEALAIAERALQNKEGLARALKQMQICFDQLSDDDKAWCKESLTKLSIPT